MKKLLDYVDNKWQHWSEKGMKWPFVHDPVKGKPSVTLLFFYLAFVLTILTVSTSSLFLIIKGEYLQATIMPMMMWFSSFIFYRLRRLDSVKIDLDDRSIELDGSDDSEQ